MTSKDQNNIVRESIITSHQQTPLGKPLVWIHAAKISANVTYETAMRALNRRNLCICPDIDARSFTLEAFHLGGKYNFVTHL